MKTIHLVFFLCILVISTIVFLYRWNWYIDRLDTIKIKNDIIEENKNSYLFGYLVDSPPCSDNHRLIMIITSYFGHIELRSAHRRTYPVDLLENLGIKRVFLLATVSKHSENLISQKSLINENQRFRDIVQGNFEEAYRNLTYKHLMGLEWASRNCKNADIIIKMDDDMVYSISNILSYLKTIKVTDKSSFLLGYVMKAMRPIRNRANKWFVTYSEYSKSFYPPFLSGWMYFTTPLTASRLVQMASNFPYFWIDDVFISGMIASSLNIKLLDVRNSSIFLEYYELMKCCLEDMLNKNIYCEFAVGPNGGDDNMLIKFDNALSHCDKIKCSKRPSNLPLKDTCVTSKDLMPFHKGNPVVDIIKL